MVRPPAARELLDAEVFPVVGGERHEHVHRLLRQAGEERVGLSADYDEWSRRAPDRGGGQQEADTPSAPAAAGRSSTPRRDPDRRAVRDVFMFSSNQSARVGAEHSGVTRFSYDLRTINLTIVREGRGPRNVDSGATGTTPRRLPAGLRTRRRCRPRTTRRALPPAELPRRLAAGCR
ncbi:hypothetical protein HBB16_02900 [Pseudonocardia sp. MCCB 268]|nr:hypothetical protein [Pseudonocardia cytotoxica]